MGCGFGRECGRSSGRTHPRIPGCATGPCDLGTKYVGGAVRNRRASVGGGLLRKGRQESCALCRICSCTGLFSSGLFNGSAQGRSARTQSPGFGGAAGQSCPGWGPTGGRGGQSRFDLLCFKKGMRKSCGTGIGQLQEMTGWLST